MVVNNSTSLVSMVFSVLPGPSSSGNTVDPHPDFGYWIVNSECILTMNHPSLQQEMMQISTRSLGLGLQTPSQVRKRPRPMEGGLVALDRILLNSGDSELDKGL